MSVLVLFIVTSVIQTLDSNGNIHFGLGIQSSVRLLHEEAYCSYYIIICVIAFTVHNMDPTDLIPERRAKSWKREHEERCRRHQNNNDLKKCRDPGYGPDQYVLLEMKDNSTDLMKDAVRVEKMEMSASDKLLNGSGDVDVENEGTPALRTTTENSAIEYESTNKVSAESDVINNLGTVEGILCDGRRSEIVSPLLHTAEDSDVETENNLCEQYLEKEGREDFPETNGVCVDFKGDSIKPGHIYEGLSLCENMEESDKSHMILQQFEIEMPEITSEGYSKISGGTESGSSKLHKVKSGPLEVSAESSELTVMKGTELVHLEKALTRWEDIDKSLEIPEWVPTRPADVKPETLEDATPRFPDIMKDAAVERASQGQSGFKDVMQELLGNINTVHEDCVNTEEPVQKADVLLDTGEELGNYGERGEIAGSDTLEQVKVLGNRDFEIVDPLGTSQDAERSNSSSCDLENRSGAPNGHLKGSLKTDDRKYSVHAEESILSSFETPGNVAEKLKEEETSGVKQGKNLFVELCREENFARPVEFVDKLEHSVCVLASAKSVSPFQDRQQSNSEFLEDPGTFGENNKFVTDSSFGNVAAEYKTSDTDSGTMKDTGVSNVEIPAGELNEENPKHSMDKPALEIVGDMFHEYVQLEGSSVKSKYCLGIDIVPDQTLPSETVFFQPSAMASEDKVNILGLMVSWYHDSHFLCII